MKPGLRRRSPWWALLLVVALAVTVAGILPIRQIFDSRRQVELTESKLAALEAENARLAQSIELLNTDAEIERIARERFGLVREGEVGYVVEWVEVEPAPRPTLPPADQRPWYRRVLDYVTGLDGGGG